MELLQDGRKIVKKINKNSKKKKSKPKRNMKSIIKKQI
jgi:hypothetical protein